jgi:hypothetical protein
VVSTWSSVRWVANRKWRRFNAEHKAISTRWHMSSFNAKETSFCRSPYKTTDSLWYAPLIILPLFWHYDCIPQRDSASA